MKSRSETVFDRDDIRRAAYSMICNYGRSAAQVAGQRASNLAGDDLKESRLTWERIAQTIETMQHLVSASAQFH